MSTKYYLTMRSPGEFYKASHKGTWDRDIRAHGMDHWTWLLSTDKTRGGAVHNAFHIFGPYTLPSEHSIFQRWITNPLDAQTISGTLQLLVGARKLTDFGGSAVVTKFRLHVYATIGNTNGVRGVLLDNWVDSGGSWNNSATIKTLSSAATLSSVAISAGDRVVVEIGAHTSGADLATDPPTITIWAGTTNGDTGSPFTDATSGASATNTAGFLTFSHTFIELSAPAAPANDDCADAETVTALPYYAPVVNTTTAVEVTGTSSTTGRSVWYSFTPDFTGTVILSCLGSNYRTKMTLYTGTCGSLDLEANMFGTVQWVQRNQHLTREDVVSGTNYFIRIESQVDTYCAVSSGGELHFSITRLRTPQAGDVIVNAQFTTVYRDGELINYTNKFHGFTPTGSSIDYTGRPITSLIDASTHTGRRLAVVLFPYDLVEYVDLDTLNHNNFAELTYTPMSSAGAYTGEHPSSIVWDRDGNYYVSFFGDNYDVIGELPSDPDTAVVHKFDGAITTTNSPGPEVSLLARYTLELENSGTDYIELASDQRTLFYTSAGTRIMRYDVVDDVQLSDFASVANASGPRPGLRGLRLLPPGDGSGGLLATNGSVVHRLNSSGTIIRTYTPSETTLAQDLDKIELTPDATAFYVSDQLSTTLFKFNVATGAQIGTTHLNLPIGQLCGFSSNEGYRAGVATIGPPVEFPETGPPDQSVLCPCPEPPSSTTPTGGTPILLPALPEPVLCGGGGLVPTAADLTDSEIWWGL